MVSVVPASADGCVDIHDLSALVQETMWKSMISVVHDCKGQGSFFCNSIDDFRLVVEIVMRDIDGFWENLYLPPTQKRQSLNKTSLKRMFKNYSNAEV